MNIVILTFCQLLCQNGICIRYGKINFTFLSGTESDRELFNKRRSGEASRMTVEQYVSKGNWTNMEEFKKSFSSLEEELAKKLTLI